MKQNKRTLKMILSLALALVFVFSLSSMAFAANEEVTFPDDITGFGTPPKDYSAGDHTGAWKSTQADTDVTAAITKEILTAQNVPAANVGGEFTFTFEPVTTASYFTLDQEGALGEPRKDIVYTGHPTIPGSTNNVLTLTVDASKNDATKSQNLTMDNTVTPAVPLNPTLVRWQYQTGNIVPSGNNFPNIGTYVYRVSETAGQFDAAPSGYTKEEHFSKAEYLVYFYVDYKTGSTTDKYVKAIGVVMTQKNQTPGSTLVEPGEARPKVNPEDRKTSTDPTENQTTVYDGAFTFVNNLNLKHTTEENGRSLVLKKTVKNNTATGETLFPFYVEIAIPRNSSMATNGTDLKAKVYNSATPSVALSSAADLSARAGQVSAMVASNGLIFTVGKDIYNEDNANVSNTAWQKEDYKAKGIVWLRQGESLVFDEDKLPVGTSILTTELITTDGGAVIPLYGSETTTRDFTEYKTPTTTVIMGNVQDSVSHSYSSGSQLLGLGKNDVTTENTTTDAPPTGILMNNLPFFILIAISAAAILAYVVVRGTKREGVEQ